MTIEFDRVSFSYLRPSDSHRFALQRISFQIAQAETVGLAGPSGSGKTTLMQLFTGLLRPDWGRVLVDGKDIQRSRRLRLQLRRRIGLAFQFPETQLFAETVFEDVAFGPRNQKWPPHEVQQRVREAMDLVGLDFDLYAVRSPFHLSQGEKRRVALAGILAMRPQMLVLDEPTAALDSDGVLRLKRLVGRLHREGVTVVWISHDLDLLFEVVERFVLLRDGEIVFDGPKSALREKLAILTEVGLEIPRIFHLIQQLRHLGWPVPDDIHSLQELRLWFAERESASQNAASVPSQVCDS